MALKQLALSFWLIVSAASAAENLGINVKTVRRHYGLMRRGISLVPLCPVHDPRAGALGEEERTGLCLLVVEEGLRIVSICCEWISSDTQGPSGGSGPCRHLRLRRKLRLPAPLHVIDYCLCFADGSIGEWPPAGERELIKLDKLANKLCRMERRRGRLQRAPLLEELAYRFNHRSNPGVTAMLYDFMKPVCSTHQHK
jgi:hypothetical protein